MTYYNSVLIFPWKKKKKKLTFHANLFCYGTSMFWAEIWKNVRVFIWKKNQYLGVIFSMYLNRRVFVMYDENTLFLIVSLKLNLLFNLYHFMGKFSIRQIDDIFLIFSPENRLWQFMQISQEFDNSCKLSPRNNLHELSKPMFWEK